jgi:hypothetical protein
MAASAVPRSLGTVDRLDAAAAGSVKAARPGRASRVELTLTPEALTDSGDLGAVDRERLPYPPLFVSQHSGGQALPADPVAFCGGQRHSPGLDVVDDV